MKEEIDFTKVPYQYAMCLNRKCSKANTCLRQLTEQSVPEKIEYWDILSPKHLAALQGDCPYYRSNTKVRYAKGFIKILEALPYKQMYKRQNKLFHFHKTFCSEFDIINTKQNVHFTKVVSPIFQFCLSLHQFSIGAKVPFINKRD